MNISTRVIATSLVSTLMIVTPAFAQHRSSGGHSASRGGRAAGGAVVRSGARPVAAGGRVYAQSRGVSGVRGGSAVVVASRGISRGGYYVRSAPVRFYRPYYAFRPHFSLGFGLWVGYPVAYSAGFYAPYYYPYYDPYYYGYYGAPYPYPYPYPNYYPYPYGGPAYGPPAPAYPPNAYPPGTSPSPNTIPPPGSTTPPSSYPNGPVTPNRSPSRTISVDAQRNLGGFSFEVSPNTAQVFVDGNYMGTVGEFTPQSQPLGVQAGNRRVELRADGYRTVQFDAEVVAGKVLPYQGAMQR